MAVKKEDKFAPVAGQGATHTPCKVHWLVGPPSKENGHVVGTKQKIKYFGVIEVKPIPNIPGYQNLFCMAKIYKIGPDGEDLWRPTEEFSYDKLNKSFNFGAIPYDIHSPDQDFCRFILLRHVHFPEAGTYRLEMTVRAFCSIPIEGQEEPEITNVGIDEVTTIHVEVKDGVTWDERRTHHAQVNILALLEWYPVVGCNGYQDKETGEMEWQQPMYCANPRRTAQSDHAGSSYAESEAASSDADSLITVVYTGGSLTGSGSGSGNQAEEDVD